MPPKGKGKGGGRKKKQKFVPPQQFTDKCPYTKRITCLNLVRVPGPVVPAHPPTPLHISVKEGNFNTVKFLVANGADVNVVDAIGSTPLLWAAAYGQRSMMHFLVSLGADVNRANDYGMTFLHCLVVRGELDLAKFAVAKGALINTQDMWGSTPLMTAVVADDLDMVCFLLNVPKFVEKPKEENDEPKEEEATEAVDETRDPEEVERELRRKKRQEERERKEREALEREKEEQDKANAEKWAHHYVKDKAGWTALHHAAARGHAEVLRVLVRAGADKNSLDAKTGETPLHKAILHGRIQCVRYLEGADVSIKANNGTPLITVAAMEGYASIFQWLVEQGADYKTIDADGNTTLHHAAANDHFSIVRYLVTTLGENLHVKNKDGNKPLMLAHDDAIKTFLQRRMLGELTTGEDAVAIGREKSMSNMSGRNSGRDSATAESSDNDVVRPNSSALSSR